MYILPGIFIIICMIFLLITHFRKKRIIRKLCCMDFCKKQNLLNDLIHPFGFFYNSCEDIFSSVTDAWQRSFGYRALFDRAAPDFNMVYDCEPVYFDYADRTWLIELWKGQYGINTGGEIGIYCADGLLTEEQYAHAQFHSIPEDQMLPLSMKLKRRGKLLFAVQDLHWWLTGFCMGEFSYPEELTMSASLSFPDETMMNSFIGALQKMGYTNCDVSTCARTVTICFSSPCTGRHGLFLNIRSWLAQFENRLFVRLFRRITKPFSCTVDRLLYLYYFLPPVFRRTVGIRQKSMQKRRFRAAKDKARTKRFHL